MAGQHGQLLSLSADLLFSSNQMERALTRAREATRCCMPCRNANPAKRKHSRAAALALATFGYNWLNGAWEDVKATWTAAAELLVRLASLGGLTPDPEITLAITHR
jgi:hypothetical protein